MSKLQSITTSLQISKQLKEAGYPQDSLFYWIASHKNDSSFSLRQSRLDASSKNLKQDRMFAAPTASEILERLPKRIFQETHFEEKYMVFLNISPELKRGWLVTYENKNFEERLEAHDESLSDALSKMWLYLHQQGLTKGII